MNIKRNSLMIPLFLCSVAFGVSCSNKEKKKLSKEVQEKEVDLIEEKDLDVPPATWQEHWFEHQQLVKRVYHDQHLALYYDDDVDPSIVWPKRYLPKVWEYIKSVYGFYGEDPRLYVILHTDKYSGGHPSVYMDESHDFRNVIDCGPYNWKKMRPETGLNMIIHEIGHIVEGATNGIKHNPAWDIWKDSKWAEIFIYDVYMNTGKKEFAQQVYDDMTRKYDDFPRKNTQWFMDWFYPIYSKYGESEVLNDFYDLLALYFPKKNESHAFTRRMNMGEFVHFWSGAAGADLQPLAEGAFGWSDEWQEQLFVAKSKFRRITY